MQPITQQNIIQFTDGKIVAIAGASRNEKSFSASVIKHLSQLNYALWLVNPNFGESELVSKRVNSIEKLPADVNHLLILTPATETEAVVRHAIDKGIRNIWIQQNSETSAAIELAMNNGVNLIHHQCIFMFAKPTGLHKFHRAIKHVFGSLPK